MKEPGTIEQLKNHDDIIIHEGTKYICRDRGVGETQAYRNIIKAIDIIKEHTESMSRKSTH